MRIWATPREPRTAKAALNDRTRVLKALRGLWSQILCHCSYLSCALVKVFELRSAARVDWNRD